MSLAFLRQTLTRPIPPPSEWDKPWNELHRWTRVFVSGLVLTALIVEFVPIIDRSEPKNFIDADQTDFGFPLSYLTIGQQSTKLDVTAFLADVLSVGALIFALACWMERYMRRPKTIQSWPEVHHRTWILLAGMTVAGTVLEVYPIIREYGDERMNLPDYMGGNHWLGRGVPFTYHRIDPAETWSGNFGVITPFRNIFDPLNLVFDFILLGAVIAEATYWFERWQLKQRVATAHDLDS
jgi:hypothetical protein